MVGASERLRPVERRHPEHDDLALPRPSFGRVDAQRAEVETGQARVVGRDTAHVDDVAPHLVRAGGWHRIAHQQPDAVLLVHELGPCGLQVLQLAADEHRLAVVEARVRLERRNRGDAADRRLGRREGGQREAGRNARGDQGTSASRHRRSWTMETGCRCSTPGFKGDRARRAVRAGEPPGAPPARITGTSASAPAAPASCTAP
jgi:hypothetical protein